MQSIIRSNSAGDRAKWSRVVTIGKPQSNNEGRIGRIGMIGRITRPGATADSDSTLSGVGGNYRKPCSVRMMATVIILKYCIGALQQLTRSQTQTGSSLLALAHHVFSLACPILSDFNFFKICLFCTYEYFAWVSACVPYAWLVPLRPGKGISPLDLKLELVVSHHVDSRDEPRPSARASALNLRVIISPAPVLFDAAVDS